MPTKRLKDCLDREGVRYESIRHDPAYTMSEIAHAAHLSGKMVAKTTVIRVDGKTALAVLPSPDHVDLEQLRDLTGAAAIELATEREFAALFPGCEPGAMPPFGNLYGMDVFVSPRLMEQNEIAFNAGTHIELIKLAYRDFERLVHPKVLDFVS